MPDQRPEEALQNAYAAVAHAKDVRDIHRRRTHKGSKQRENDIQYAHERLKAAMAPLRTIIGRFPYGAQTVVAERNREAVRAASREIQAERRKLWKMSTKRKEPSDA